jgi:hypothetical protein
LSAYRNQTAFAKNQICTINVAKLNFPCIDFRQLKISFDTFHCVSFFPGANQSLGVDSLGSFNQNFFNFKPNEKVGAGHVARLVVHRRVNNSIPIESAVSGWRLRRQQSEREKIIWPDFN